MEERNNRNDITISLTPWRKQAGTPAANIQGMMEDHKDAASPADPNPFFQDAEVGRFSRKKSYLSCMVCVVSEMFEQGEPLGCSASSLCLSHSRERCPAGKEKVYQPQRNE